MGVPVSAPLVSEAVLRCSESRDMRAEEGRQAEPLCPGCMGPGIERPNPCIQVSRGPDFEWKEGARRQLERLQKYFQPLPSQPRSRGHGRLPPPLGLLERRWDLLNAIRKVFPFQRHAVSARIGARARMGGEVLAGARDQLESSCSDD
jgi:hypothetical protein